MSGIDEPTRVPLAGTGYISITVELDLAAVDDADWAFIERLRQTIRSHHAITPERPKCPECKTGFVNSGGYVSLCPNEFHLTPEVSS